jgi:hypothetical protein
MLPGWGPAALRVWLVIFSACMAYDLGCLSTLSMLGVDLATEPRRQPVNESPNARGDWLLVTFRLDRPHVAAGVRDFTSARGGRACWWDARRRRRT